MQAVTSGMNEQIGQRLGVRLGERGVKRPVAYIAGTGRGIPAKVMTNHDFAAIGIETDHDWIVERTGIVERHIAAADETTMSMAATASRTAMQRAGVQPARSTPSSSAPRPPIVCSPPPRWTCRPSWAPRAPPASTSSAACTGWVYGMTVAEGLIASGVVETALVVGAEKMSAIVDWKDRSTCVLFGDGAGAVVLKRGEDAQPRHSQRVHAQRRHPRRAAVAPERRREGAVQRRRARRPLART